MDKAKQLKWMLPCTVFVAISIIFYITEWTPKVHTPVLTPHGPPKNCPFHISEETITPLNNTKHFLVSAYMDQRVNDFDIRIISMFRRDSIQPLHCFFCCAGYTSKMTTPATVSQNPHNFGYPFVATDVRCRIPQNCSATHVTLHTQPGRTAESDQFWLPIRNKKDKNKEEKLQYNFTVCISTLYGNYSNVLQFAQTLEIYRLLGVDRVVIYNTSSAKDLDRLLQSYSQEGFVEMVSWPIDKHMTPSTGWLFSRSGGDIHYFGQLVTLNECIYRSMERSRYVLLNDIDEIIMPYQHNNLMSLMDVLQQQHPKATVFLMENHVFPNIRFEPRVKFHLPQWNGVSGNNILERIYTHVPNKNYKMIIQPRLVEQTSVHTVLKNIGQHVLVPPDVCRNIHVREPLQEKLTREQVNVDIRLWDFHEKLIPSVDRVLERAGLLGSEEQSSRADEQETDSQ